jgi:hypothetical protein
MNQTHSPRTSRSSGERASSDTAEKAASLGRRAAGGVKDTATDAASSVRGEVSRMLDRQVETGAAYLGHAASSIRSAADELSRNAPPLAGFADTVANKLDAYAETVQGKSAEELWDDAIDFTRRQPALVFGLASLAGFLVYRTIKSTQPATTDKKPAREFHGA